MARSATEPAVHPRVYIAGPMTGMPEYNFPAFFAAEARLRSRGWDPVNPARHDEDMGWVIVTRDGLGGILAAEKVEGSFNWGLALDWDLKQLERCAAIYLLPGWSRSRGACKEYAYAMEHHLRILGATGEHPAPPETQPLVGLVGYSQAGKDTFAGILGYCRLAFADPLKQLALACNPVVGVAPVPLSLIVLNDGWEFGKAQVPGVREFLQNLGVGVRDILGADTWVDAAFAKYDPSQATVFTDVRFPNEIEAIRGRGGVIVRIDRTGHAPANNHVSEFAWQSTEPNFRFEFATGDLVGMAQAAANLDAHLREG